ncbi:MAG: efflux RND transporter periplasmic adaptor subunit [Planctomycetes bacterium]|nr:efflux RND transporter periplasmic adaptor subunit [Planctomycetota bacterium]
MVRVCFVRVSCILLVPTSLFAVGCGGKDVAEKTREAPRVTVAHPVVRELVDEDDYNGWLDASATVEVRSRVRGHIQTVHFKDGDVVEKGQLLFELDPRPFQVEINQAQSQVRALEAQKAAAEKDVARYSALIESGGATRQQLEKAQADVGSYEAQIAAKMEEVKRHELELHYSRITAEMEGRTSKANLTEGNLVNAGGTDPILTTIVALNPIHVYFSIDERAMQLYQRAAPSRSGDKPRPPLREQKPPFHFGLDTETGYPHEGYLDFADNRVIEGTGTLQVRGVVDNKERLFVPGSRVRVRLPVSDKYSATLVPDTAVNTDQDRKYLLVVGEGDVVDRRDVELGRLLDDGMRIVLKPQLKPDTWIIVEGMERARLKYPVEPIPEVSQDAKSAK